jgi:dethiobiotin synthetase
MAADALGLPRPTIAQFVGELAWPRPAVDVGLVETAGGVRSPQADDGDVIDMMTAVAPDAVVLVADAGLGTVNVVRLSVAALTDEWRAGRPTLTPMVVLNRYDSALDLHRRNLSWLRHTDGFTVVTSADADLAGLSQRLAATVPGLSR